MSPKADYFLQHLFFNYSFQNGLCNNWFTNVLQCDLRNFSRAAKILEIPIVEVNSFSLPLSRSIFLSFSLSRSIFLTFFLSLSLVLSFFLSLSLVLSFSHSLSSFSLSLSLSIISLLFKCSTKPRQSK